MRLVTATPLSDGCDRHWGIGMPTHAFTTVYRCKGQGLGDPFHNNLRNEELEGFDHREVEVEEEFNDGDPDHGLVGVEHMLVVLMGGYEKW